MTIYYVNPTVADNTGAGTTPATAKKVIPSTVAGDRVRLKRGTTYTGNEWPALSGTAGAHIVMEAYANTDGSDDATLPRPIMVRTTPTGSYSNTRDFVDVYNLDLRGDLPEANDAALLWLGTGSTARNVRVDTNVGAFAAWNENDLTVQECEFNGVSHDNTHNNNLMTVSADKNTISNIRLIRNVLNHKGGGGVNSHIIRAETATATYDLVSLVIDGNVAPIPNGAARHPNPYTMGLRTGRCPNALIQNNKFPGTQVGGFVNGGGAIVTGVQMLDNDFTNCYMFGIHLPGGTRDFKIGRNDVSYAGSNLESANWYGRGIEISAGGGQGQNGGHEIFRNVAGHCYNYGGPSDNGSEGVGIGLDDGTDHCYVWGNELEFNEGNGIQQYGGNGTDTGGHRVVSNYFESNCMASFYNRRTGGGVQTVFVADCAWSAHKGSPSICANNVFVNSKCGISEAGNNDDILDKANNLFIDVHYPFSLPVGYTRASHNGFYAPNVNMVKYTNTNQNSDSSPAFGPLEYQGENDYVFNPLLDALHKPMNNSPLIGAGLYLGTYNDFVGNPYKNPPSIGMYEVLGLIGGLPIGQNGSQDTEYGDAASILVPIDIIGGNTLNLHPILESVKANGVELVEDTRPLWNVGSTYSTGQQVYMANTHRVYESVKDANTGKLPSDITNQFNAAGVETWWRDIGPTNRYAMFDGLISSATEMASPAVITLNPGQFNGFALIGIDADTFSAQVTDGPGGNIVYNEPETSLEGSQPTDYYEYFFGRFKPLTRLVRANIDPYANAQLKITLTKANGLVKLGMLAVGDMQPSGIPQRDATVEPQDFSVVKQDGFGRVQVKKRANATGMSITTKMDKEDAGAVLESIKDVLGVPVVVIGSEAAQYEWMTVFGLVSARMTPDDFPFVTLSMTVRGLI
jgi:hypothetical protein